MRKRLFTAFILICVLLLGACGKEKETTATTDDTAQEVTEGEEKDTTKEKDTKKESKVEVDTDFESLEAVLDAIETDMKSMTDTAAENYTTFKSEIDTYKKYKANPEKVDDFFETLEADSDELLAKYDRYYEVYFRMALYQISDNKKLDRVFDDFYDAVYDDAFEDYYDEIYDNVFDDFYDDIYDEMFDNAYDTIPFKEYSDAHSEVYQKYIDAHRIIYQKYLSGRSKAYIIYKNMRSNAIYGEERDYDAIMAKVDQELEEKEAEEKRVSELVEVDVTYEIRDGKAYVTGMAEEGTKITIKSEYEDCDVVGIAASAFEGSKIQTVSCWADLEMIGDKAFKDCTDLVEFSIPSSVTVIGNSAFENCSGITNLVIWGEPDIGERAFAGCTGINYFSAGSDTNKICDNAFDGCSGLESVIIWNDDTEIGKDAFANCPKLSDKPKESGHSVKLDDATTINESAESDTKSSVEFSGIRPEFQEAMDEYKAFFKEYCDFLKKYSSSSDAASMLKEYTDYMTKYVDTMEALDKVGDEELTKEEDKLYLDTMNEINKMLIDAM